MKYPKLIKTRIPFIPDVYLIGINESASSITKMVRSISELLDVPEEEGARCVEFALNSNACVLHNNTPSFILSIMLNDLPGFTVNECYGLIAHEATHLMDAYREHTYNDDTRFDRETYAYSLQELVVSITPIVLKWKTEYEKKQNK